jgi:hypothetical protein
MSQQVWHVKEPSLLKEIRSKHRSKFAIMSPIMVKNCPGGYKQSSKQTNKNLPCITRVMVFLNGVMTLGL